VLMFVNTRPGSPSGLMKKGASRGWKVMDWW
jgi:hypothetical protein